MNYKLEEQPQWLSHETTPTEAAMTERVLGSKLYLAVIFHAFASFVIVYRFNDLLTFGHYIMYLL